MQQFIKKLKNIFFDFISPPFCEGCKKFIKERTIFCETCYNKIIPIVSGKIKLNENYDITIYAISNYQEPLKSLILAKKASNYLASKQIGELIWGMTNIKNLDFDYIVPIPLHWTRYVKRGFNQTEVIAEIISEKSRKPIANILKRKKITAYQSSLTQEERYINVKEAFELTEGLPEGKKFILVDDLLTSGATIKSAAKKLLKLKPVTISVVVACKVI